MTSQQWAAAHLHRRAALELARGIDEPFLAIKGLCVWGLTGKLERPLLDVDLVPLRSFARASTAIRAVFSASVLHHSSRSLALRWRHGAVDVQRWLWPPPCFVMRRVRDRALQASGGNYPLWFPCIEDAATIAVMHYVKDGLGRVGHGRFLDDLASLQAAGLRPRALAARLTEFGLRRAGIVVFRHVDAPGEPWLQALEPTPNELHATASLMPSFDWGFGVTFNTSVLATAAVRDSAVERALAWTYAGLRLLRRATR